MVGKSHLKHSCSIQSLRMCILLLTPCVHLNRVTSVFQQLAGCARVETIDRKNTLYQSIVETWALSQLRHTCIYMCLQCHSAPVQPPTLTASVHLHFARSKVKPKPRTLEGLAHLTFCRISTRDTGVQP